MKRTVAALLILLAVTAYAEEKRDPGKKMMPPFPGMHPWIRDGGEPVSLTKDEAKAKFASYVSASLKGFEIKEINTIYMPFGTLHQATLTDKSGNRFFLDITPDGEVRGLMQHRD